MRFNRTAEYPVSADTVNDVPKPATDPKLPPMVSLTKAGEILGVKRAQAHRILMEGDLPGAQIDGSGAWVFRRALVEEIAAKRRGE